MLLRKREPVKEVSAACDEICGDSNAEKFGWLKDDCEFKKQRSNPKKYHPISGCLRGCFLATFLFWLSLQLWSYLTSVDPCVQAQKSLQKLSSEVENSLHNNAIPKIIHQQWRSSTVQNDPDNQHARFGDWHQAWLRLYPESQGYRHMLWTDDAMLEHIETYYSWFLPVYQAYDDHIKRIDAARYFILDHYGGLYADMDYEPLQNFWPYLAPHRVSLIQSPYNSHIEHLQNSLMASPPHHPFWNATFQALQQRAHYPQVLSSTGPRMLDSVVETTHSSHWYELPCENFHRLPSLENSASPWLTQILQQALTQINNHSCGAWHDVANCQWGRHHNTATWIPKGFSPRVQFFDRILVMLRRKPSSG